MKWSLVFLAFFAYFASVVAAQAFQHGHDMTARRAKGQCAKYPQLKHLHDMLKSKMPKLHEKLMHYKQATTSESQVNETVEAIQQLFQKVQQVC
ncbi:Hypothetical protein MSYG_0831 [Malassezia sympodialis ATCC 42132]|uniref:Uncharacterized protein n=1 Tax=Malassezia sympodialis (strain ATCC 42132) TaxID=1230383 RepID=A0A1M8A251_MALS4|nr:Hypothetical protein MSYG_0831 [Malassezia sympodialis ATCC 42132]